MLDPKKIAELEQARASIGEQIPALLWSFYVGLKQQGFTQPQAFVLTEDFLCELVAKDHHDMEDEYGG